MASDLRHGYSSPPKPVLQAFWGNESVLGTERVTPGFSGAEVWRVSLAGQDFCLHGHLLDRTDRDHLLAITRLATAWSDAGLPVPKPIRAMAGAWVIGHEQRQWVAETWRPGLANFAANPSAARLQNACASLARLHAVAESWSVTDWIPRRGLPLTLSRRIHLWQEHVRTGLFAPLPTAEFADEPVSELARKWLELAPRLASVIFPQVLKWTGQQTTLIAALRDVWHDHVLYTGEVVTGLIDLGAAAIDSPMADLSRLLGSLVEDDATQWQHGIAAYRAIRPGGPEEPILLDLFDATSVLLSGTTWLARWKSGMLGQSEALPQEALLRERVRERWEWLIRRLKGRLAGFRVPG